MYMRENNLQVTYHIMFIFMVLFNLVLRHGNMAQSYMIKYSLRRQEKVMCLLRASLLWTNYAQDTVALTGTALQW